MNVSRETELLARYANLIRRWNPAVNLVSPASLNNLEQRHISDSLQLARLPAIVGKDWVDLGSGGGLPGLVVAIAHPDTAVTLVESDLRKASFLRTAIRELGLANTNVIASRIEGLDRLDAANVSARALAPLPLLLSYVARHIHQNGTAWLMKGRNWRSELAEAQKDWAFDLKVHNSETDADAVIMEVTGIRNA